MVPNERACVDFSVLERICDASDAEGKALARRLLELFLERTPVRLEEMQRAVESCDLTHLRQVAHQLKSTSANIGARRFRELCIEIEKAENLGDVGALLGQLITEYQLIQRALEAELERNR